MGWWTIENTDDLVGDEVFSLLRNAAIAVAARYAEDHGRLPTRREWQALMWDSLQPVEDPESGEMTYLLQEASRPTSIAIVLAAPSDSSTR